MGDLFLFIIFITVFLWLPGWILVRWTELKLTPIQQFTLSTIIGTCVYIYLTFLIRMIQLPFAILYIYGLSVFFVSKKFWKSALNNLTNYRLDADKFLFCLVLVGTMFALSASHLQSGFKEGRLIMAAPRDSFWRISIINELIRSSPPQFPGYPSQVLKNYHYLFDLLIASTHALTKVNIFALYTKFYILFSAALLVLVIYTFLEILVNNRKIVLLGTVLTVFAGNLSYLLPFISKRYNFLAKPEIFMSNQPFDQSHNPFNLLAYALFLGIILLFSFWRNNKNIKVLLVLSVCIGILPGIKIYAGVLILMALMGVVAYEIIKSKKVLVEMILPVIFTVPILIAMRGSNFNILSFNPGWVLTKMIEDQDRLYLPDMVLKEQYYRGTGNILRLVQIKLIQISIYLIGNLNIRLLALGLFLKQARTQISNKISLSFLLLLVVLALLIPVLFSQNRGVYDSIQFTPYALLILSLLSVPVIAVIINSVSQRYSLYILIILSCVFLGLAMPTNIILLDSQLKNTQYEVAASEVRALDFLRMNSNPQAIILADLDEDKMIHMYVSALSQRNVYLSGASLAEQTGINTQSRRQEVEDFYIFDPKLTPESIQDKRDFLYKNSIEFIYLSHSGLKHQTLMKRLELPLIYYDQNVLIYAT